MIQEPETPLQPHKDGCLLYVYANPKASRTQLAGQHGGRLKIQVASPPVDGKANDALIKFLASTLDMTKANVILKAGHTGKRKTFLLMGQTLEAAQLSLGLQES